MKKFKTLFCVLVVTLVIAMGCILTSANTLPFSDVSKGVYYYDAVSWAYQNNITKGTSDTTFAPGASCNRGQVVTFLWRAAGCPAHKTQVNPFKDVAKDAFYYDAVLWANENNITNGTSTTTFSPLENCNYEQILAFIHRAQGQPAARTGVKTVADNYSDSAWYKSAIQWAASYNLLDKTTGYGLGKTCPRCDIVQYLYTYSQSGQETLEEVGTTDVRINDTFYSNQAKKISGEYYISANFAKNVLGTTVTSSRADGLVKATDAAKAAGAMYEYSDVYDVVRILKSTAFTYAQAEELRSKEMTSRYPKSVFGSVLAKDYDEGLVMISDCGTKEERLPALTSKANSYELMNAYGITGKKAVEVAKAAVSVDCSGYTLELITDETMTWLGDTSFKDIVVVRGYYKLSYKEIEWKYVTNEEKMTLYSLVPVTLGEKGVEYNNVCYLPVDIFVWVTSGKVSCANALSTVVLPSY